METLMSCFAPLALRGAKASTNINKHVTDAPDISRHGIGPASQHLREELLRMYWAGVEMKLPNIILTLHKWQSWDAYAETVLPDEEDPFIHGYDTFLDAVTHSTRQFSARNRPSAAQAVNREPAQDASGLPTYTEALENRGWDLYTDLKAQNVRSQIRSALDDRPVQDISRRRAQMLLQSAQFLDMDKVIEYREQTRPHSFWKRPAPPQLAASKYEDVTRLPILEPVLCSYCRFEIQGSVFQCTKPEPLAICEGCYRQKHYGQALFTKRYKTCCLNDVMDPKQGRQICCCPNIERRDNNGCLRTLWPLDEKDSHLHGGSGKVNCGLLELTDLVAEAKFGYTRIRSDKKKTLHEVWREDEQLKREMKYLMERNVHQQRPKKLANPTTESLAEFGHTYKESYGENAETTEGIPRWLKSITDEYPFGNIHMALRLGPLLIENGVANTHGGALITFRDTTQLQTLADVDEGRGYSLLVTGKTDRMLWSQDRPREPKRYKAMLKQVAGGAFSGLFGVEEEEAIVTELLWASQLQDDEEATPMERARTLRESARKIAESIRRYLASRVDVFIDSIIARLVDPAVNLHWDFQKNNCQTFCDNLIDREIFGSLLAPNTNHEADTDATLGERPAYLYLMSFVCRPGAYIKENSVSKFDVPNGLIEEYLLKFRYGRHDESDVIDTLAEYWYDWGAFEKPIYPYQDVFPWDCTEAYGRYPVNCNECNLAKHVWAFPFDSWSLTSLHLLRGRHLYPSEEPPPSLSTSSSSDSNSSDSDNTPSPSEKHQPNPKIINLSSGHMSDHAWFKNRLTILLAQSSLLTAAAAMSRSPSFRESTLWLHAQHSPTQDRLKLGGIHRAQPFSHHFERGAYRQYYVAEWASLPREGRIRAYEKLRDWRATRKDIGDDGKDGNDNDGGGGCGSCGGFACGALVVGCAGGLTAPGDDAGGDAGCVSSCSSGGDGAGCSSCSGCSGCGGCGG